MRKLSREARAAGKSIGLVPTMGALHAGHLSLLGAAREQNGFVAASIFLNPAQFAPGEDYKKYPRPLEKDLGLCAEAGVDAVFTPAAEEMYAKGVVMFIEPGLLADQLEGLSRPGHFRGVAPVVAKLFNIVEPDRAYFGRKDAQQLAVIRQLVRDFDFGVEIVDCPTVREADGLAVSSRNACLSPKERQAAAGLYQALQAGQQLAAKGERRATAIAAAMAEQIVEEPLAELDYAAVVDPETFEDLEDLDRPALAALAVRIGKTRLIDNAMVELPRGRAKNAKK